MKTKKSVLVTVLFVVLLIIVGFFSYQLGIKKTLKITEKQQTQNNFLYNKLTDIIPSDKMISGSLFYDTVNEVCLSTREKIKRVFLDKQTQNCPAGSAIGGCAGTTTMSAIICGNQYIIEKFNMGGPVDFGPFPFN